MFSLEACFFSATLLLLLLYDWDGSDMTAKAALEALQSFWAPGDADEIKEKFREGLDRNVFGQLLIGLFIFTNHMMSLDIVEIDRQKPYLHQPLATATR